MNAYENTLVWESKFFYVGQGGEFDVLVKCFYGDIVHMQIDTSKGMLSRWFGSSEEAQSFFIDYFDYPNNEQLYHCLDENEYYVNFLDLESVGYKRSNFLNF